MDELSKWHGKNTVDLSHSLCIIYKEKFAILYTLFHGSARLPLQKQLAWCLGLKEIEERRKVLGPSIFFTHHLNISLYSISFFVCLCLFLNFFFFFFFKFFIHHLNLSLVCLCLFLIFFLSTFYWFFFSYIIRVVEIIKFIIRVVTLSS